jgi:predicted secreted Zn-dependent protease
LYSDQLTPHLILSVKVFDFAKRIAQSCDIMFRESFPALALILALNASTVACAKDVAKTVSYLVQGKTAAEVYDFIKTKSPRVAGNATFAFTMIATKTDKKEKKTGGACGYSAFKTSAIFNYVLPRHQNPTALKPKTRAKWVAFESYLKTHESGHRDIWVACFAKYDAAALSLSTTDCTSLDKQREKTFTSLKRECLKQDEAYDVVFRKDVLKHPFVAEALKTPPK